MEGIKIGKNYYTGYGSGLLGTLAIVKPTAILRVSPEAIYSCELVKLYIAFWKKGKVTIDRCYSALMYNSFKEAKEAFFQSMEFKNNQDVIRKVFK